MKGLKSSSVVWNFCQPRRSPDFYGFLTAYESLDRRCKIKQVLSSQVKDVIYSCRLASAGQKPLVCVDEAQVEIILFLIPCSNNSFQLARF